jgi:hypothetical protein
MTVIRLEPPDVRPREIFLREFSSELELYCWDCPMCGFHVQERVEADAQQLADEHVCDVCWCPVPMTAERLRRAQ